MQKLVWINSKETEINLTSGDYGITEWEGFSACDLEVQTQNVPFQDGSVFLDALLNNRELSVTLAINDGKDLEKRYRLRRELISALNPKLGEGYLIYTNDFISKRIKCLAQMPVFPTHNSDKAGTPKASLSWTACDPYWEDVEESKFSYIAPKQVTINNEGDVPTQLKIELFSAITNPSIKNLTTKQQLNFLFDEPKNVEINTNIGNKNIFEIEDTNRSYFSNLNITRCFYSNKLSKYVIIVDKQYIFVTDDFSNIIPYGISNGYLDKVFEVDNVFYSSGVDTIYYGEDLLNLNTIQFEGVQKVIYSEELNLFCLIAGINKIYVSSDFTNWTDVSVTLADANKMSDIIYCNYLHKFIAVNEGCYLLFSSDGHSWTSHYYTELGFRPYTYIYSAENKNILFSYNDYYCRYSQDGLTWINTLNLAGNNKKLCFFEKDNIIYCATQNSNSENVLKFSLDGKNWFIQYENFEGSQINEVVIDNLITYFLGSNITLVKTMDFIIWEPSGNLKSLPKSMNTLEYIDFLNVFLYAESKKLFMFKEDINENQLVFDISDTNNYFGAISVINNVIYVMAKSYSNSIVTFYKTTDLINWESIITDLAPSIMSKIQCINKVHRYFCCESLYRFFYSDDLIHWNNMSLNSDSGYYVYNEKINLLIFVSLFTSTTSYRVSNNYGNTWTSIHNPNISGNVILNEKNQFVVLHENIISISDDGYTWETISLSNSYSYIFLNKFTNKYFLLNSSDVYFSETFDFVDVKKQEVLPRLSKAVFSNNLIFLCSGTELVIIQYEKIKNCIKDLLNNSDMNFKLDVGENVLNFTPGQFSCNLYYRQKYIGV